MTFDTSTDRVPPPPPSGPLPGRLSLAERVRRSELLERAVRQREAHALDKASWTKTWKRKDEYFAELIARLTREAGTGVDEGGQLSLPGTEPAMPEAEAEVEVLTGRWAELARVTPPRFSCWTLQEAALSPAATRLLELLRPVDQDGVGKRVTVPLGALPELLDCTAAEALDAAAELLCLDLAKAIGGQELATGERCDGLLRLDSWNDKCEAECGLVVLRAMLETRKPLLHADELLLETKLPRRVLLPLLRGLTALGAVECIEGEAEGETYWRRVARVPLWEGLALEALRRAEGVEYLADRALEGCIDLDWAICGLVEAGALRKAKEGAPWGIVAEDARQPLSLDDIKAKVKAKVAARGATRSDRTMSVDDLARDLSLQIPTMQRACEALAAEGYLVAISKPGTYSGYAVGPWYKRAEEKAGKATKGKGKTSKGKDKKSTGKASKGAPKPAKAKAEAGAPRALGDVIDGVLRSWGFWLDAEHLEVQVREALPLDAGPSSRDWRGVLKDMLAQGRIERREEEGRTQYRIPSAQDRTAPLFGDVAPAPAREDGEAVH